MITFERDGEVVEQLDNEIRLKTSAEHMKGYCQVERSDANPLVFDLPMSTIRFLTMKKVLFDVTAYVINKQNKVEQIIFMKAGSKTNYMTEISNLIIEVPSDLNLDIRRGDSIIIEEGEEGRKAPLLPT